MRRQQSPNVHGVSCDVEKSALSLAPVEELASMGFATV